jgi:hypothetical protein
MSPEAVQSKPESTIAGEMGSVLVAQYKDHLMSVIEAIDQELVPMVQSFYRDVAQIPIL